MKHVITNPEIGDSVTYVHTAKETNGATTELEVVLQPGGGNPLHYHRSYDEIFTAIEGDLGVGFQKGKTIILKPGESYTIKGRQVHRFFNPGDTVIRFRDTLHPGHEGFENHLRILYGLAADGMTDRKKKPKKLKHLAIIAVMSDTLMPGILSLAMPLLRVIEFWARKSGEEKALIDKYCA